MLPADSAEWRNTMQKRNLKSPLLLLLTATIWGVAFVAQSVSMDYIEPFTFNCIRFLMGGLVLIPVILIMEKRGRNETQAINMESVASCSDVSAQSKKEEKQKGLRNISRIEWIGGIVCGLFLCAASNFQQVGIQYTTVGRAGFITALYVVLVPVFGLFFRKKVAPVIWLCVVLSVVGLYLLCMSGDTLGIGYGDLLQIICAAIFAFHILAIDYFSPKGRGVVISCIQFFVSGGISMILMFLFEHPQMANIFAARVSLLYAGVLSCGVAYTLQVVAQKGINPTVASLILCLESVISVLAGWVILGQALSFREFAGCGLMFLAIVLAQVLPGRGAESAPEVSAES